MIRQKQNFLSANWIAPADSTQFSDSSVASSFLVRKAWWTNRAAVARKWPSCHEKNSGETIPGLGTIDTKHFLWPIRSQHLLDCLEMIRWESVPRGFSTWAWKLFSRLFSLPDWLPLGLQGWGKAVCQYLWLVTGQVIYSYPYKEMAYLTVKPGQAYPQESINEFVIQKLNPLIVVDFRLISAFLYV